MEKPACIARNIFGEENALCGRSRDELATEFHYQGLDHWFNHVMRGAMPSICPQCLEAVIDVAEGLR